MNNAKAYNPLYSFVMKQTLLLQSNITTLKFINESYLSVGSLSSSYVYKKLKPRRQNSASLEFLDGLYTYSKLKP